MTPPTVVAVKCAATQVEIALEVPDGPPGPPEAPADEVVESPFAHVGLELGSVGAGSLPLKPPIAMIASPEASW